MGGSAGLRGQGQRGAFPARLLRLACPRGAGPMRCPRGVSRRPAAVIGRPSDCICGVTRSCTKKIFACPISAGRTALIPRKKELDLRYAGVSSGCKSFLAWLRAGLRVFDTRSANAAVASGTARPAGMRAQRGAG